MTNSFFFDLLHNYILPIIAFLALLFAFLYIIYERRETYQGLEALVSRPSTGPQPTNWKSYLDKLPKDPWGQTYLYLNPGVRGEIDVFSLGADGQPDGSGADSDIGSWDL